MVKMATKIQIILLILLALNPSPNLATISDSFRNFVQSRFGRRVADLLARDDLGEDGSYGGGLHLAREKTDRLPIIFVHGLLTNAGSTQPVASFFQSSGGYSDEELYATSYGPAGTLPWDAAIQCQWAQAFRYLIIAVSEFTNSQVNVIAYSLGVPVVRKAMLGGRCVDGGDLGRGALTPFVNTFLAVAGPNQGIPFCATVRGAPSSACNGNINGEQQHYEAQQAVFSIQSTGDFTVGTNACGLTQSVPGADFTLTFEGLSHVQVLSLTVQQQFNLVTKHSVN